MVKSYQISTISTLSNSPMDSSQQNIGDPSTPNGVPDPELGKKQIEMEMEEDCERGNWSGKAEFVLSCLGYAVGLGNVWRFPYLVYSNGGGAFLIPFLIMLFLVGLPCFFMEMIVGQFSSNGPMHLWSIAPLFTGIGLGMEIITFLTSISYNIIMGWSFYYLFASWQSVLPWYNCKNHYNTPNCFTSREEKEGCASMYAINVTTWWYNGTCYNSTFCKDVNTFECNRTQVVDFRKSASEEYFNNEVLKLSDSIDDTGNLQWQLVLVLLLAWIVCYLCVIKGIKSAGKVVYFTALFPYVILFILLIRGALLPGSMEGVKFYIIPKWEKLANGKVWVEAAGQVFFSLSVGMGGLMTFASYNKFNNNIYRDTLIVVILDAVTSIVAGFAIFSIVGHLAHVLEKPVDSVVKEGPGLAFIIYPEVVTYLEPPQLWATLFFIMLITLAIDTQMAAIETIMTACVDFYPILRKWKPIVAAVICFIMFILGLPMCAKSGMYWLELMNTYSSGWSLVLIATVEVIVFSWFYGARQLLRDVEMMTGHKLWHHWWFLFKFVSPVALVAILIFNIIDYQPMKYDSDRYYPSWSQGLGWCMALVSIIVVPVVSVYIIWKSYDDPEYDGLPFYKRLWILTQASSEWLPGPERERRKAANRENSSYANKCFQDDSIATDFFKSTENGTLQNV